jgi:heat shock protein 5
VEIIANEYGHFCTPSWVAFGDNDILVGDAAKKTFDANSENTVFDVMRLLGRTMTELDTQQDAKHWPFKVKVKDGKLVINVRYRHKSRDFTPEEISGLVLAKMKEMAQDYLDQEVTHAVVTVPIRASSLYIRGLY